MKRFPAEALQRLVMVSARRHGFAFLLSLRVAITEQGHNSCLRIAVDLFLHMAQINMQRFAMAAWLLVAAFAASADDLTQRAAKASTVQEAMRLLGVSAPEPGRKVLLDVPDLVLKGRNAVIKLNSQIPGTDWMAVLVEPREAVLIDAREFAPGVDHSQTVQVAFQRTSVVHAIVRAGGKYYLVKREVKVVTEEKGFHGR